MAARRALSEADVVVADRLAPRALLDELSPDVELVDVAKLPRGRSAAQEEINRVIVERARAGKRVVRFKGGDSFVFGRGYEEAIACAEAGVPCRVVPGLTSAISVPAVAGIPVTHRGVAHEFTVISGHLPPGHPESLVEWDGRGAAARHRRAPDGGAEPPAHRRRPASAGGRDRGHAGRDRLRGDDAGGAHACCPPWAASATTSTREQVRPPAIVVVGDGGRGGAPDAYAGPRGRGRADRGRRPRRPAARRLPRPPRRRAAQAPRGRARAVPRRGREGGPAGRRGRLRAALVPDGAALARRARRRAGRHRRARASSSRRRWPSRSPASTCTVARWRRCVGARCRQRRRGARPAHARCWSWRTSSTTPTSGRSCAAARRSASTPCCSRRAARTRSTGGRSRSAMGAVFSLPWTRRRGLVRRAARRCRARGFTTVAMTLAPDAAARSRTAVAGLDRVALVLGGEGHGLSSRRWQQPPTAAR